MKKLLHLLLAGLLLVTTAATAAAPYANNRAPLREKKDGSATSCSARPTG